MLRRYKPILLGIVFAVWCGSAFAATVPALATGSDTQTLSPIGLVSAKRIYIDSKKADGIRLANEWKKFLNKPRRGADGSVRYMFGTILPTLVCTPLDVCNIRLQPGEVVNDIHASDIASWKITRATVGSGGDAMQVIIVSPTDAGLTTNLSVTTDRRLYSIKLASTQNERMPLLSFDYPDDFERVLTEYHTHHVKRLHGKSGFWLHDRRSQCCLESRGGYSDGFKTYIQSPAPNFGGETHTLVAQDREGSLFSKAPEKVVNYQLIDDRYIADKLFDYASPIPDVVRYQADLKLARTRQSR